MTPDDAFLRDIIESPDDDTPRLIYADFLDEQGQPERAEFIRLQCLLAGLAEGDARRRKLQAREEELLAEHGTNWAGPFLHLFLKRDLLRGRKQRRLRGQKGGPAWMAFSPGGLALVTSTQEWDTRRDDLVGAARVWDLPSGKIRLRLRRGEGGSWAALSPDGRTLAWPTYGPVHLIDLRTGQKRLTLPGHTSHVYGLAFRPDGRALAATGNDGLTIVWSLPSGQEQARVRAEEDVKDVVFAPDGNTLVTGGRAGGLYFWDGESGQRRAVLRRHEAGVYTVAFSPDGGLLASAGLDRTARLWDGKTGKPLRTLAGHEDCVLSVAFSPDGRLLATAGGELRLWDVACGAEIATVHGLQRGGPSCVAFSLDGRVLAAGAGDDGSGDVVLWDVAAVLGKGPAP